MLSNVKKKLREKKKYCLKAVRHFPRDNDHNSLSIAPHVIFFIEKEDGEDDEDDDEREKK